MQYYIDNKKRESEWWYVYSINLDFWIKRQKITKSEINFEKSKETSGRKRASEMQRISSPHTVDSITSIFNNYYLIKMKIQTMYTHIFYRML